MRLSQSMVSRGKGKKSKRNQASSSSSQRSSSSSGSDRIRARKKQKRLDAICEQVYNRNHVGKVESNEGNVAGEAVAEVEVEADAGLLRRSSRVRRAPALLDASPVTVRKRPRIDSVCSSSSKKNEGNVDRKKVDDGLEKTSPVQNSEDLDMDDPDSWKSRLRSRANHVSFALLENNASPRRRRRLFDDSGGSKEVSKVASRKMDDKIGVVEAKISVAKTKKRSGKGIAKGSTTLNSEDHTNESYNNKEEHNVSHAGERISRLDNEGRLLPDSALDCGDEKVEADNSSIRTYEKEEKQMLDDVELDEEERDNMDLEPMTQSPMHLDQADCEKEELNCASAVEAAELPGNQLHNGDSRGSKGACVGELGGKPLQEDKDINVGKLKNSQTDTLEKIPLKEGRRCGLCGGGIDGKPPKRLLRDSAESDNDTYDRSSFSEEVNYDVLDGFGDDPRWLGRLLGPINDRFGIAGVWVHQNCAVWSPEVYFAGLGCLKNVRAALCRGRSLKCSRCGRPGATIGCRVDRCPKTYHLPCGRADGCIFYHRKFLIACIDHRHLFQPHGGHQINQLKEIKIKKMKLEMRKHSYDASRKDLEVEEKWLENCGEDEEFLKRESKRLQRDLLRIAPVYIGGSSSENDKLFQGWESVAGLQDVIQCMKEVVILPLLYPEVFNSLGLTPPRGVLLHGYPGTGKTLVVRALIGSCARGDKRIAYFARKGADCLGKYVGDAERQLRLLFQVAEKAQPSIIFFDEIDGLAPCRTRQQDQTHNSVVSTLLALMDGLKSRGSVIVIGATNRPESVDPALRRPGRFDREVYFPLPSVKDRTSILSLHTRRWPKPIYGSLLKWIAQQTAGFAGADLQALCTQAVMIALKRNFPLQELMSAAENKATNGRCPPLPSFPVEESDWLDALASAPPPCSRREAGMAANDVVSSPLRSHLIPFLLQPLSHLLVSLFRDERVLLPPSLNKASKLIKGILISTLEKMQKSTDLWWCHVHDLIQDADVAEKIKTSLSSVGLLIGSSTFVDSNVLDDDNDKENEKFERHKVNLTGPRPNLLRNISTSSGRASGFRVLIAGSPKSGQSHLAACILHGFVGHVEIQKINLATISQEGRGDVVQGMTYILMKCARAGLCIVYMPRIDLWAMQTDHLITETESDICANTDESTGLMKYLNATKTATQAWNSFVEQMDSLCLSASLMVLATSEVSNKVLPSRISQFFAGDRSSTNDSVQQTVPSFLVQLDGNYDSDIVVSASATELALGLVEQYVQLIHHGTHTGKMCKEIKISYTMDSKQEIECHPTENGTVDEESVSVISGIPASKGVAPYNEDQLQQNITIDKQGPPMPQTVDNQENEVRLSYPQDSVPRVITNNRSVKGKSSSFSAISTFGYQILRYPHFSELCWTTSKLKEGPCTDINGPWKGWPFNSCIIRPKKAVENVAAGWSSSNHKNKEHSGIVRGLTAVGILAYKGVYTSIREVSLEVRKVLELLVKQIDAKIVGGKDRYRFLRLLSQVAYLEDMVNNWAYSLQSLDDNQLPTPKPVPTIAAFVENPTGSSALKPNISPRKVNEEKMREQSPDKLAAGDGDHMDSSGVIDTGLPTSKAGVAISEEPSGQIASLDPLSSSMTANNLPVGITSDACNKRSHADNRIPENYISGPVLNGDYAFSRLPNDLTTGEMVLPSKGCVRSPGESGVKMNLSTRIVSNHCNGTAAIVPSQDSSSNRDEAVTDGNLISNKSNGASTASGLTCMYNCCSACLHAIYLLIRKVLLHEKERNGRCWTTIEDVHDAVSSISVNLLAAVRKFCITESDRNSKLLSEKRRQKSCTCQEVGSNQSKEPSCQCKGSGNCVGMPIECSCHLKNDHSSADNPCTNSQSGLELNLVFRDGVLIPSGSIKNVLLHCKYEKLCLGSLTELVLTIKQPSS